MKMQLIYVFILLFISINLPAQNLDDYNRIYTRTFLETSQKDFNKALKIADSLYNISESPKLKAKSLMLSATLLQQSGDLQKAVGYALKAEKVVIDTEDYLWQAKINGFLSSQYRNLSLFDKSKKYIIKSLNSIEKLTDEKQINNMTGFVMQEQAYYEIEFKNYRRAIGLIKKSQMHFELSENKEAFLTANNLQLEGLCYYKLTNYNKSFDCYRRAQKILDMMPDNFLKGLVYNGLARLHIDTHNLETAKQFLKKAENISEHSNYLNLKNEIYNTSLQYYLAIKDVKKIEEIAVKKDSAKEKIDKNTSAFINKEFSELEKKNTVTERKNSMKTSYLFAFAVLLIALLVTMIIRRQQFSKNLKITQKSFDVIQQSFLEMKAEIKNKDSIVAESAGTKASNSEQQPMMPAATEEKLIAKLEKFEKTILYTQNSMSLPYLATYCGTNTKYLSYIINQYKGKDFNNYINELRVNYIIIKIQSEPKYLKFKVASLAEEAGFSSQSKFANAFKKVTGISPSQFLQDQKKQ